MTCGRCGECNCWTARIKRWLKLRKITPKSITQYSDDMCQRAEKILSQVIYDGSPALEIPYKRLEYAIASFHRARELIFPIEGPMIFLEKAVHLYLSEVEGKDPAKAKW